MKIYKIYHHYDKSTNFSKYIRSNMSQKELTDLLIGFQFYIETTTRFGLHSSITNEPAVWFLCRYYNCKEVDRSEIFDASNFDSSIQDVNKADWIDLYLEREKRCGENYEKYIIKMQPNNKSDEFHRYCHTFDMDTLEYGVCIDDFKVEDIIKGKVEKIINSSLSLSEKKSRLKKLIDY